jgi:hypothetical protein
MTQAVFEALQPTLAALREVKSPSMPVSVALAEGSALLSFLNDEASPGSEKPGAAAQAKLVAVGLPVGHVAAFGQSLDALRYAQAVHQSKGLRVVGAEHAQSRRGRLRLARRHHGRLPLEPARRPHRPRRARPHRRGRGAARPDQRPQRPRRLDPKQRRRLRLRHTFDPDARAESCRQAAANVEALTSGNATEQDKRDTADARDRAWTHFKSLRKGPPRRRRIRPALRPTDLLSLHQRLQAEAQQESEGQGTNSGSMIHLRPHD